VEHRIDDNSAQFLT